MRFTLAWLKEYLNFDSSLNELCEKLTSIGLEVENFKNPKENLNKFLVAEIVSITPHPNADKLKVCEVNNGNEVLKIVCGAPNVREKMKSVLASKGCIIKPGTKEEFKIAKSKIRGIESFGMLCSEAELDLSDNSQGIIELEDTCEVGEKFSRYLNDENVEIEIAITPNRVDCAGVYGIARDLSAAGFGRLKQKKISKMEVTFESEIKLSNTLKDNSCPQFSLREIRDLKNPKSPKNFINRFRGSNLKLISSLVDITNYLTIDYCRPLHVFDLDKIEGDIKIRYSQKGEKFLGLDENEYVLDENMIVICDEKKIISLAGVMGGMNTACDEKTKNVLLESAYFDPEKIAYTGRRLNISSDARYRFERGIDPNSTLDGMELATEMILENCGGRVGSIIKDFGKLVINKEIVIDTNFIRKILGTNVDESTILDKFSLIGCNIKKSKNQINVIPPSWRPDIKIKVDLVEEVARLVGYEKIPSKPFQLDREFEKNITPLSQKFKKKIRELLVSRNIMESISWSFANKKWEEHLGYEDSIIEIANPISSELSCLRSNLVGGLLNLINKNNNKGINNISVFEIGPVFYGIRPGEQKDSLTVIRSGKAFDKNWTSKSRDYDIFDLKSDLFSVLKLLKLPTDNLKISEEESDYFHPGKNGSIFLGEKKIASFGELHPNIAKKFKIKSTTCLFELKLSEIFEFCKEKPLTKSQLIKSSFQASIRDFSFEVSKDLSSIDLVNCIKKIDQEIILDVKVFDNYQNKDLRAIALEVILQSNKGTLTENEINELSEKIINQAKTKFNARLR
jgi:phenylalanyl-tRNA synthetase beta chain